MKVILLDIETYKELLKEMQLFVEKGIVNAISKFNAESSSDWITIHEAKELLPLKSKTSWQKLRDNGSIKYTQFGRKIMYSRSSINQYLSNHKV